jgi:hypothetical protein
MTRQHGLGMSKMRVLTRNNVLRYVQEKGDVSFAELENTFRGFSDPGDEGCAFEIGNNLILWTGMSREAFNLIEGLFLEKAIDFRTSSHLVYLLNGRTLNLPLAKQRKSYKDPRWLPVTICPGEPEVSPGPASPDGKRIRHSLRHQRADQPPGTQKRKPL